MLLTLVAYTMYSKWTSITSDYIIKLTIIHEHFKKLEILLANASFIDHVNLEAFCKQMSFDCLKQYHLPRSQHATPPSVRP